MKLLLDILARLLGNHCPLSHQLASFLAEQPLLNTATGFAVLKLTPEPSQGLPRGQLEDADGGRREFDKVSRSPSLSVVGEDSGATFNLPSDEELEDSLAESSNATIDATMDVSIRMLYNFGTSKY